jgi:hypothetical protein
MRKNTFRLGTIYGLKIMATRNVPLWALVLALILFAIARLGFKLNGLEAAIIAIAATFLHYFFELVHNLGHAWAARRSGYPMSGLLYWTVLGRSLYPRDEPELPTRIHVQRALGGPLLSLVATLICGLIFFISDPQNRLIWLLAGFAFLNNLLVYTLGALTPLGFTDGSTLLRAIRSRAS